MQTLWEFYAWGFVLGLAVTGLGDIPAGTVVARHVRAQAGLALGVAYIGSNIGGALVPLVASAVTEAANWRVALQVLGALGRQQRKGLPENALHIPLPGGLDSVYVASDSLVLVADR